MKGRLLNQNEINQLKSGDKVYIEKDNEILLIKTMFRYNTYDNKPIQMINENDNNKKILNVMNYEMKNYKFYEYIDENNKYSATEIIQKIEDGELIDDDVLIDKNGNEDSVYDVLEQSIMALKDYAPYQIKKNKYVKFEEAKNSGKKFKYKTWEHFYTLIEVYEDLLIKPRDCVKVMINEKMWEIEE